MPPSRETMSDAVGLLQLEWRQGNPNWAGMNQQNDLVGEAAVEMVINMIHNHSPGIPAFPLATLVGSTLGQRCDHAFYSVR